jgi:hypothetical protein
VVVIRGLGTVVVWLDRVGTAGIGICDWCAGKYCWEIVWGWARGLVTVRV